MVGSKAAGVTLVMSFSSSSRVHLLEPRIGYGLLVVPKLAGDPLFVPFTRVPQRRIRQQVLENVIRDESDRIEDFNGITWGVGNRFYRRGTDGKGPRLLAELNLRAQYDFANGGHLGNFILDGVGELRPGTRFRFNLGFDPEDAELDEALAEFAWSSGGALKVQFSYRYLNRIPRFFEDFSADADRFDDFKADFNHVNQADVRLSYRFTENWSARYQAARSFETNILLANKGAVEYLSKCECWAASVEVRQNRQFGFEFGFSYRIVGLGYDLAGGTHQGGGSFGFLDGL